MAPDHNSRFQRVNGDANLAIPLYLGLAFETKKIPCTVDFICRGKLFMTRPIVRPVSVRHGSIAE